jgi:hypothetical protein
MFVSRRYSNPGNEGNEDVKYDPSLRVVGGANLGIDERPVTSSK